MSCILVDPFELPNVWIIHEQARIISINVHWLSVGFNDVQGATGQQGNVGVVGSRGAAGDTGSTGFTGYTGTMGVVGDTGATGATGFTGHTGQSGDTGEPGGPGLTGAAGDTGRRGVKGDSAVAPPGTGLSFSPSPLYRIDRKFVTCSFKVRAKFANFTKYSKFVEI